MDLSKLSLKTDLDFQNSLKLSDINGITGIIDNTVTGADSLTGLLFPSTEAANINYDIHRYDDNGGAYPIINQYPERFAFLFDIKEDYKLRLQSEITDHWTEENFVVNDHVANKPIEIELTGKVNEVRLNQYWRTKSNEETKSEKKGKGLWSAGESFVSNTADRFAEKAGSLTQFAPNIVNQAIQLKNSVKMAYNAANKAKQFVNKLKSIGDESVPMNKNNTIKREQVDKFNNKPSRQFNFVRKWFCAWWQSKTPFILVTPYGTFYNMYIIDFNATQGKETAYTTNVAIKFKQLNIARTKINNKKSKVHRDSIEQSKGQLYLSQGFKVNKYPDVAGLEVKNKRVAQTMNCMDKNFDSVTKQHADENNSDLFGVR